MHFLKNENVWNSVKIALKFIPKGLIDDKTALVQVMTWRWTGNKPLHAEWRIYICVNKLTVIGSDNGLSPGRRPTVIWTNAGILLIGPMGTNFNEILIEIVIISFKKCIWKRRQEIGGHSVLLPEPVMI